MNNIKPWFPIIISVGIVLLIAVIGLSGFGVSMLPGDLNRFSDVTLSTLLLAGAVILLLVLALIAVAFATLNLATIDEALGLPKGSVRALIALILLILFAILALSFFSRLGTPPRTSIIQMSVEQFETLDMADVYSAEFGGDGTVNVVRVLPQNSAQVDFANQVITIVGTLVSAIAAFYFGSRSAMSAMNQTANTNPTITRVSPKTGEAGKTITLTITGSNFRSPGVQLIQGDTVVDAVDVTASIGKVTAKVTLPAQAGQYDVIVTNADGTDATLAGGFTIKAPPAE